MIDSNGLAAGVTVLGEHTVEAAEAVGSALSHDVPLTSEVTVALETGEVNHMPGSALGLSALVRKDYLKIK